MRNNVRRRIIRRDSRIKSTIPAIFRKARVACMRYGRSCLCKRSTDDSAGNADSPFAVKGAIALCGNVVSIFDHKIPGSVIILKAKRRKVRLKNVRSIWNIDDERTRLGSV